jgi:hypothetical protein
MIEILEKRNRPSQMALLIISFLIAISYLRVCGASNAMLVGGESYYRSSEYVSTPDLSESEDVYERIIYIGENKNRVINHLDYLVNRIGARPSGSENLQKACEWAKDKFSDFGLENVHLEECGVSPRLFFYNLFRIGERPIYNVIADIPGTEKPDDYVIIGAHIDSDDAGDGATDNGTGVCATLEAARILMEADARPVRTIRFILFSGEEIGKVGSRVYVADHRDIMRNISVMLNMDQGTDYISGISATRDMISDFKTAFAPVLDLNPELPFVIKRVDSLSKIISECCGSSGTSDHGSFHDAGVPALIWQQEGINPSPYYAHTRHDTFDKIVPEYIEHSALVIALGALGIANLDNMITPENSQSGL